MVKYKPKTLKSAVVIGFVVVMLVTAANLLGIGTVSCSKRIGYVCKDGWRSWSARYTMLSGRLKHTIHLKDTQETVHVKVVTEDGSISIEMKDTDGNVIFEDHNMVTSDFDVPVSGKTVIRIEADHHKGSFHIEAV